MIHLPLKHRYELSCVNYLNEYFVTHVVICFPGLLEIFQNNNALLDQIQKCLEAYLESKCVIFPRYTSLSLLFYREMINCQSVIYQLFHLLIE